MTKQLTLQEKAEALISIWSKDPILGVRQLFGVDPTKQQIDLILSAWNPQARTAASSCQGAGKTTTLVWLTILFLLTQPGCRILITSPSSGQLKRVFMPEIHKWYDKMPKEFQDFLIIMADKVVYKERESQFAQLVTASADNKESLQGGHADNYVVLADEASGIEEAIFDLLLGTLGTGKGGRFIITSNPLRSSGRFSEVFNNESFNKWDRLYFSAYDSPNMNPEWIEEMKETYGEDSDIFRVRVLGQFPRASSSQYISSEAVTQAQNNTMPTAVYMHFPKIIGVDVARFGDDKTVFVCRQGPKLVDYKTYSGLSTMEVVSKLIDYQTLIHASAIFIDTIGVGAGVTDRAIEILGNIVKPVIVSNKSTNPLQYVNLRSQLWGIMKEWLENGASIPNDDSLRKQLTSMCYGFNNKMQVQLMAKKDIKKLGLDSPDIPDALAYTFAGDVFNSFSKRTQPRAISRSRVMWA